jgi:hypothetical protein
MSTFAESIVKQKCLAQIYWPNRFPRSEVSLSILIDAFQFSLFQPRAELLIFPQALAFAVYVLSYSGVLPV